jgi:NAD(P)-dependent dehydrogenase (short-subunit alcohol dehydrogenase family)
VPDRLLEGRRALVTGAARGIGLATARRFREEGATVAVSDVLPELAGAASSIGAIAVPFDVTDEAAVEAGVPEAHARLGGLDTLVAVAGVLHMASVLEDDLDAFRRVLDVNLLGTFLCCRAAGRLFREQGRGVILATSSQAGLHGYPNMGAYCASKFGVIGLVEALAKELGPHGVRVNAVAPGLIATEMHDAHVAGVAGRLGTDPEQARRRLVAGVPLGRAGTPEEVADVFVFLASDRASYISGATVRIEGGEAL